MKISSSFNNNYKYNHKHNQVFKGVPKNFIVLPSPIGTLGRMAGTYVGIPEQKLLLASSAFVLQPFMDLRYAQKDKKSDVAIKSASKALAGGITGVTIRVLCDKYFNDKIGYNEKTGNPKHNWLNSWFFPSHAREVRADSITYCNKRIKQYCSTLSGMAALAVMIMITNDVLDVPLTSDFQDLFSGVAKDNKTWSQSINDVYNSRIEKIKMWFKNQINDFIKLGKRTNIAINIIKDKNSIKNIDKVVRRYNMERN